MSGRDRYTGKGPIRNEQTLCNLSRYVENPGASRRDFVNYIPGPGGPRRTTGQGMLGGLCRNISSVVGIYLEELWRYLESITKH